VRTKATVAVLAIAAITLSLVTLPQQAYARASCRGHAATKVGTNKRDVLKGTLGRDVLVGLGGNDDLLGFEGNDVLCGGAGHDNLVGSFGDDVHDGGGGNDLMLGYSGRDVHFGGGGPNDAVAFWWSKTGVRADLGKGRSAGRDEGKDRFTGIETLLGSPRRDVLIGSGRSDWLYTYEGNDVLRGKGGKDMLVGSTGNDVFDGGDGRDLAQFFWDRSGVTVDLAAGRASSRGDVDRLRGIEAAQGSENGNNKLYGDGKANVLYGTGEKTKDELYGRGGNDLLLEMPYSWRSVVVARGGPGNDKIHAPKGTAHGDEGNDLIRAKVAYGGTGNDRSWGGYAYGEAGNDTIIGSGEGGEGKVVFAAGRRYFGGPGIDVMHADTGRHVFGHEADADTPPPPTELDIVSYVTAKRAVDIDMAEGMARHRGDPGGAYDAYWTIFHIVGSRFNDTFVGHDGDDAFVGFRGSDRIDGGAGNDLLDGGREEDTADGGLGVDRCPRVESRSFCEDELDDLPVPPSATRLGLRGILHAFETDLRDARSQGAADLTTGRAALWAGSSAIGREALSRTER
jgi:Ca2+-binding RTX toxin-like protein